MNKITLISESTEYFNSIDKCTYPTKKVVVELDAENLAWTDALREFLAFLNSSGYIINPLKHQQIANAAFEIHHES